MFEGDSLARPNDRSLPLCSAESYAHSTLLLLIHHPVLIATVVSTTTVSAPVLVHHAIHALSLGIATQKVVRIGIATKEPLSLLAHAVLAVVHSTLTERAASAHTCLAHSATHSTSKATCTAAESPAQATSTTAKSATHPSTAKSAAS